MYLLNFGHHLTAEHLGQIATLVDGEPTVVEVPVHFDQGRSFVEQVGVLVDGIGLAPEEWQTRRLLVNPPTLNLIAVTLLAELHGRIGYFPTVIRLRPVAGTTPPRFEVAEVINLQTVRDGARQRR